MKGVIFGAGSVGRGFVAELFAMADMDIYLIDIDENIIDGINKNHNFPHFTVYNNVEKEKIIQKVTAINSKDEDSVIAAIKSADLIATSLGVNVLPIIAPLLAKSLKYRFKHGGDSINILLCENLADVEQFVKNLLFNEINFEEQIIFEEKVGLLATSIGRMIPVVSEETRKIHPAAIKVEPYNYLPYDGCSIKGNIPDIPNLIWDDSVPFTFYSERKLYIHNMGHCITAYLAEYKDYKYVCQAIYDADIRFFVRCAMLESAMALSLKYNQPLQSLIDHIDNLLMRFANRATGDTNERVGRDPVRKLKSKDRLLGAYINCLAENISCPHLSLGLAAGLLKLESVKKFEEPIENYLMTEAPLLFQDAYQSNLDLLMQQIELLRKGFKFPNQIELLDQYSPKNII